MTTLYHTPIPTNAPAAANTFNTVYSDLDSVSEDSLNGWMKKGANLNVVSRVANVTNSFHIISFSGISELRTINVTGPNSNGLSLTQGRKLYLEFSEFGTIVSGGNINTIDTPIQVFSPSIVEFTYNGFTWFVTGMSPHQVALIAPRTVTKTIFPREISIVAGNAMTVTMNTAQLTGGYFFQNAAAQFDTLRINVNLSGGAYEWGFVYVNGPGTGIITPTANGNGLATFDCYAAALTYNQIITRTFTANNGINTLQTEVLSRNGSSSGFAFAFSYWWLRKL